MTFLAALLLAVAVIFILRFVFWYRRWKKKLALALEENERWCAGHAKPTKEA